MKKDRDKKENPYLTITNWQNDRRIKRKSFFCSFAILGIASHISHQSGTSCVTSVFLVCRLPRFHFILSFHFILFATENGAKEPLLIFFIHSEK